MSASQAAPALAFSSIQIYGKARPSASIEENLFITNRIARKKLYLHYGTAALPLADVKEPAPAYQGARAWLSAQNEPYQKRFV